MPITPRTVKWRKKAVNSSDSAETEQLAQQDIAATRTSSSVDKRISSPNINEGLNEPLLDEQKSNEPNSSFSCSGAIKKLAEKAVSCLRG